MKYDVILVDLDHTLMDFSADSHAALEAAFLQFGLSYSDEEWERYEACNQRLWQAFDRGEIEKSQIYPTRFRDYLAQRGCRLDPAEVNRVYMEHIARGGRLDPDAKKLLRTLREMGCRLYAATNCSADVQLPRLENSGLPELLDGVYISDLMGWQKPAAEYFDRIFEEIGEDMRARAIILGDGLIADMQGGRNAGIATCFFGDVSRADDRCDYAISRLMDFVAVIS